MLQHYVFIKYQETVLREHIDSFCKKMLGLKKSIPLIKAMEIGQDSLRDARSWDLILIMQFDSVETLRTYQEHPEHQALMSFNNPFVAQVGSVDFVKS
jgi:hypothetical protein